MVFRAIAWPVALCCIGLAAGILGWASHDPALAPFIRFEPLFAVLGTVFLSVVGLLMFGLWAVMVRHQPTVRRDLLRWMGVFAALQLCVNLPVLHSATMEFTRQSPDMIRTYLDAFHALNRTVAPIWYVLIFWPAFGILALAVWRWRTPR
jgi:hypothetical protein